MGQLLPAHGPSAHRRVEDEQVAQELHHDWCKLPELAVDDIRSVLSPVPVGNSAEVLRPPAPPGILDPILEC